MKKGLIEGIRNSAFSGLAGIALAGSIYGCESPIQPEPVDQKPVIVESSVSPMSGIAPVPVTAKLRCTDDKNVLTYTIQNGTWQKTQSTPIDTTFSLEESSEIVMKCKDSKGQEVSYGPNTVQVIPDQAPTIVLSSVTPTSGMAPVSVRARLSCSDDVGIQSYTFINGLEQKVQSGPIDTSFNLNDTADITLKCKDTKGQEKVYGPNRVTVTQDQAPTILESSVTPTSGTAPVSVRARLSCSDDVGIQSYTFINGLEQKVQSGPIDTSFNLNDTADITLKCKDTKGQEKVYGPTKVTVTQPVPIAEDQIVFWSNRNGNEDIYKGDIVNGALVNVKRLTTDSDQDLEPSWSPDGNEVIFTTHRTGGTEVWRMNVDGTNQRSITAGKVERARQAHWCSNGKIAVAYRDKGDTEAGIGLINPDGTGFVSIYSEPKSGQIPGWPKFSPDCSKIAFQKSLSGNWEIYSVDISGSNLKNWTAHSAVDQQPTWSPDGQKITFISDRKGTLSLHELTLGDNSVKDLTSNEGTETDPNYAGADRYIFTHDLTSFFSPQLYLVKSADLSDKTKWTKLTSEGLNRYSSWKPK